MANLEREVAIGSILASSISAYSRPLISVTSPELSETKSHIIYKIHGKDAEGPFEVHRRYKDFLSVHSIMLKFWPGCYIPQIPQKQMIGNLDKNFIERRRKLLDVFVNKVSLLPHLYTSLPFQAFIKSKVSFEHIINDFKDKEYKEISNEFQAAFPDHIYMKLSVTDEEEINRSFEFFNYALGSFETFELICKINVDFFYEYEKGMENLITDLKNINDFYMEYYQSKGFEVEKKEYFTNPFLILLDWCRAEILDLKAIIEAIKKRSKFMQTKKKIAHKLETETKNLAALKSGKKKLMNIFSGKSVKEQEEIVKKLQDELNAVEVIFKIITCQLIHKDFLMFKQQKTQKHEVILRTFSSASVEEFQALASQVFESSSNE